MTWSITPEEAERRVRKASELRNLVLQLRRAAREAYARGEFPYCPPQDVRSDPEYWKRLLKEKEEAGQ